MAVKPLISLHPKFAAGLDLLVGLVFAWWLQTSAPFLTLNSGLPLILFFAFHSVWWAILVQITFYPVFLSRLQHWLALTIFALGFTGLLFFVELRLVFSVGLILFVLIPSLSFFLIPDQAGMLPALGKPARRWKFLMTVFGVAGSFTTTYALGVFQVVTGLFFWVILFSSIALALLISYLGWIWYEEPRGNPLFVSLGVLGVFLLEFGYAMYLLPIGYFLAGFFLTWVWYVVWLFMRFALTPEGIDWKRQRWFALINIVLMILFLLFVVRWK